MTSRLDEALEQARLVADAVLYEGYLLYPYRASAEKNQLRWQFGILGPPGAAPGAGEPAEMHAECLLRTPADGTLSIDLRFLQLQSRDVERLLPGSAGPAEFERVPQLRAGTDTWVSWDEAVPHELALGPFRVAELREGRTVRVPVPGGEDVEMLLDPTGVEIGRVMRRRQALRGEVSIRVIDVDPAGASDDGDANRLCRLSVVVTNSFDEMAADRDAALSRSFLSAHLLLFTAPGRFVSLLDPPEPARDAAQACRNARCWPVLASDQDDVVLVSPIILYDHPAVAPESAGALFDSTEIDEILTLRVMTMTDAEKAEARATDPHAAAIIDRCDAMSPEALQRLHGVLRDPHLDAAREAFDVPTWADTGGAPWWDPAVDASVAPERDAVWVGGVAVSRGSRVRVHPRRRADAQDLFFADQDATVAAVYADVDGNDHVAVVLTDDPAADLHEWYGRYLYFAPDELEPLSAAPYELREEEG
ncbi:MAG: hypothetical protein ABJB98_09650 [Actinomycetota bacterium]